MAMHTLPGIGLIGGFTLGQDGWDDEMNANLLRASTLTQLSVINRVVTASLPASPADGAMYIVTDGANANKIAVRDSSSWTYLTPSLGWRAFDQTLGSDVFFNGTAWVTISSGLSGLSLVTSSAGTGTFTYTKNANTLFLEGWIMGGGGNGGAGSDNATNGTYGGGGGGAGGWAHFYINGANIPASTTVTVGGVGGTSSFGSYLTCTGGANGVNGRNGGAGVLGSGGLGGTCTASSFPGFVFGVNGQRGGSGWTGAPANADGGDGGGTPFAPGGRRGSIAAGNGVAAQAYTGAGGSGGVGNNANTGGSGSTGYALLIEYNKP